MIGTVKSTLPSGTAPAIDYSTNIEFINDTAHSTETITIYLPCHYLCTSCETPWDQTDCQSCGSLTANGFRWLDWGSDTVFIDTCDTYCPNDADRNYDNAYPGQYISDVNVR